MQLRRFCTRPCHIGASVICCSMKRKRASQGVNEPQQKSNHDATINNAKPPRRRRKESIAASAESSKAVGDVPRCSWVAMCKGAASADYIKYHDEEWGKPEHHDWKLFELLILEGAQAGLSWSTILAKRDAYRRAFDGFDPAKVAAYDDRKIDQLMSEDSGVVRHRGKLQSAVQNAKVFLQIQKEHGSFDAFAWGFVPGKQPIVNSWTSLDQMPSKTPESEALSKALKAAGMNFVGPTIMYAFMQAAGLVDDHMVDCHCRQQTSAHKVKQKVSRS